jgi:MoxR-like ATPase
MAEPITVPSDSSLQAIQDAARDVEALTRELQQIVVGQRTTLRGIITCMLAGGHALLEGVPGLGKTLMIRALARAVQLKFSRVQFTPDLMPADILGTSILIHDSDGVRGLRFEPGPVFANVLLADEINRATPKTQSALLEAMEEKQITTSGATRPLPDPFFVLATQNPLEQEGTYPLPEAQLDRFFFKLQVEFPSEAELVEILNRTTGTQAEPSLARLDGARLREIQGLCRSLPAPPSLHRYVARLVRATHPGTPDAPPMVKKFIRYGASPRGAQALVMAAKIQAALNERLFPSVEDVREVLFAALTHRVARNFEGEAEGVTPEAILEEVSAHIRPD